MRNFLVRRRALLLIGVSLVARFGVAQQPHATSDRQAVNPPGIAPLVPAYSVAVRAGNYVFVSGMTGIKPGTQDIIEGGIVVQTRQTLENIRTALQAAGSTMENVAECTVFLVDIGEFAAMNGVYTTFFPVNPPARATVAVTALPRPAARVEIKCSAQIVRPGGDDDARAIQDARAAQNRAIVAGNADEVASFWTDDVTIRRGLGQPVNGRDAYRLLFAPTSNSTNRDSMLVYQREPTDVETGPQWPLGYETGTWVGHLGRFDGPAVIRGRYAAQWVKRQGRWFIRSEVFVALNCSGIGCRYTAVP